MENTGTLTTAARNKMALMNGLLLGLVYVISITLVNLAIGSMFLFYLLKFSGYVLYFIIVGIMAKNIRKANGGYIEFRELFSAIFIMLAVAWLIGYCYTYLYMYVIDPGYMDKIKNATVTFMEKNHTPEESIDKMVADFDKSKQFSLKNTIMGYFGWLILDSLFGLIVCAIVKKPKPMFDK